MFLKYLNDRESQALRLGKTLPSSPIRTLGINPVIDQEMSSQGASCEHTTRRINTATSERDRCYKDNKMGSRIERDRDNIGQMLGKTPSRR